MKIELIVIGKTNFSFIEEGIIEYKSRINHFINFEIIVYLMLNKNCQLQN